MNRRVRTIAILMIVVVILAGAGLITWKLIQMLAPSKETASLEEYYRVAEGEILTIQDDTLAAKNVRKKNGQIYLSLSFVQELNKRFYWDESVQKLIFTTGTERYVASLQSTDYFVNDKKCKADAEVLIQENGEMHVLLQYVEEHLDLKYQVFYEPERILLQYHWGEYLWAI